MKVTIEKMPKEYILVESDKYLPRGLYTTWGAYKNAYRAAYKAQTGKACPEEVLAKRKEALIHPTKENFITGTYFGDFYQYETPLGNATRCAYYKIRLFNRCARMHFYADTNGIYFLSMSYDK